ncbi:P-loop containing nucleoside triphosphate hydrolase protein [Scleroderma yunnanense]
MHNDSEKGLEKLRSAADSRGLDIQLDSEHQHVNYRRRFWQLWLPKDPPSPAPLSLDDAKLTPLITASIFSRITFSWVTEFMVLGYQRTIQAPDLYKLDVSREAGPLAEKLEAAWARRVHAAVEWNARLDRGEIQPSTLNRFIWAIRAFKANKGPSGQSQTYKERRAALEEHWKTVGGRKKASLAWALNDVFAWPFWVGGVFKAIGDTSQLMGPLILKSIVSFSEERSAALASGGTPPHVGVGIAMALGLWFLTILTSVCTNQFFWRSMTTGVLARATLITCIYERGVNLTGKERVKLTNAALVNHISTDVSRIDSGAQWFVSLWTGPISVVLCLVILLVELGLSALVGFSLFVLVFPLQERMMSLQHRLRIRSVVWTEKRAKVMLEVLGAMRVVKYFSYEVPFLKRLFEFRKNELREIRKIQFSTSGNFALGTSLPILAATLSLVTYTLTAHKFNTGAIFASLSLFQFLRQPMMWVPRALSAIPDASSALQRLSHIFHAELMQDEVPIIDKTQDYAVVVKDATFEWECLAKADEKISSDLLPSGAQRGLREGKKRNHKQAPEKDSGPAARDGSVFRVSDVTLTIPRGQLAAIIGPVGSGKSSLLEGIIGEMRKVSGSVSLGGRVAYCSQMAWIQNATLRENILFGQVFDEERYWRVVELACLLPDLQSLPDGDLTEIGERGINLSGGQKQRVIIARALYFGPDIVIFDDPLSAVDAHVGKSLFEDAILGELRSQGTTVLLVTHAIHFLAHVDYIYAMFEGRIAESGTYEELMRKGSEFARLDRKYGGRSQGHGDGGGDGDEICIVEHDMEELGADAVELTKQGIMIEAVKLKSVRAREKAAGTGKLGGRLIVKEQRSSGSVSWKVYWAYLVAGRGAVTVPLILLFIMMMQATQVMNSYTLVWWQANTWHRPISFYQILYGCLGIGQAIFTCFLCASLDVLGYFVSQNLHHRAVQTVFYAPMSFFDTTPLGRLLGLFGKDVDTLDNQLPLGLTLAQVVGPIVIVSVLEPYFLVAVVVISLCYSYSTTFYRTSAREVKRLQSILRSLLYAHFSETLTGLSTIRSYGEMKRFIKANRYYADLENRSLFLIVANQRWLAIRLEFMGNILTFIVALFAVTNVSGINAAQIGVVLTFTMILSPMFGLMTRMTADVENDLNSVERIVQYTWKDTVPQEAAHENPSKQPPPEWPPAGAIEFIDVQMRYRPSLPNVLNGVSLSIRGGERIGVIGRTGAGKSSLMLTLYRIVELSAGSILLDGVDISTIGLKDLRTKISIIPQDPLLFSGTIRSNLDPFNKYDDAKLWDALCRSCLIESSKADQPESGPKGRSANRYTLDSVIESEGANLSVGERSLLSLGRALVKDCKVVILDEATASVDLETDNRIQHTIKTEFRGRTLLCIAHRLRTIISYDRILVMDAGSVVEFDTPYNLYQKEGGLFRGMCERSNITLKDIETSRVETVDDCDVPENNFVA